VVPTERQVRDRERPAETEEATRIVHRRPHPPDSRTPGPFHPEDGSREI